MAWSKSSITDFTVRFRRGRNDVKFALKRSTQFSLGVMQQYISKRANSPVNVLEAMNFLSHLFAESPISSLTRIGRKFFTRVENNIQKLEIIEFRRGLFQAVHFGGDASLTINVDITTGVFWNSDCVTALDLACRCLRVTPLQLTSTALKEEERKYLSDLLKGVRFSAKYRYTENSRGREYRITDIAKLSAREYKFTKDGEHPQVTVEKYMRDNYNQTLKYPKAVLIKKDETTYFPLELCSIVPVLPSRHPTLICSFRDTRTHWMRDKLRR
jgi:eukaryotic translation initiation factor 2C